MILCPMILSKKSEDTWRRFSAFRDLIPFHDMGLAFSYDACRLL